MQQPPSPAHSLFEEYQARLAAPARGIKSSFTSATLPKSDYSAIKTCQALSAYSQFLEYKGSTTQTTTPMSTPATPGNGASRPAWSAAAAHTKPFVEGEVVGSLAVPPENTFLYRVIQSRGVLGTSSTPSYETPEPKSGAKALEYLRRKQVIEPKEGTD